MWRIKIYDPVLEVFKYTLGPFKTKEEAVKKAREEYFTHHNLGYVVEKVRKANAKNGV